MPVDWLQEFWRAAQQASPFGAMGAVIVATVLWRKLNKERDKVDVIAARSIEALVQVERTLDSLLPSGRRKNRIRG